MQCDADAALNAVRVQTCSTRRSSRCVAAHCRQEIAIWWPLVARAMEDVEGRDEDDVEMEGDGDREERASGDKEKGGKGGHFGFKKSIKRKHM